MSFPKARIQRFNEISTCAPPPGKYDPKYDAKVKGAVISKSERFVEKVEKALSEASEDSASNCSIIYNPTSLFRTPQLPKKRVPLTPRSSASCDRRTARTPERRTKKKLEYDTEISLVHQINELTRVHSAQLIEKDREMAAMQKEMEEMKASYSKSENEHIINYNTMKCKYEADIQLMMNELTALTDDNECSRIEMEKFVVDLTNQVKMLEENVLNCNLINKDLENELLKATEAKEDLKIKLDEVIGELCRTKEVVLAMTEQHKRQCATLVDFPKVIEEAWEDVTSCLDALAVNFEEKLTVFQDGIELQNGEANSQFMRMLDELTDGSKEQATSIEQAVETLQATVDGIIADVDSRFHDLINVSFARCSQIVDSTLQENLRLHEEIQKYQTDHLEDQIVAMGLHEQIDALQIEVNRLSQQCKKFQVVHKEATKTIQVLSDRLVESENEVERLNEETADFDLRKAALEDTVRSVVDENNSLKMDVANLQMTTVKEIEKIEQNLLNKVEHYRQTAAQRGVEFTQEITDKQKTIESLTMEIEYDRTKMHEMNAYISDYQIQLAKYREDLRQYKSKLCQTEDELAVVQTDKNEMEDHINRLSAENARLAQENENMCLQLEESAEISSRQIARLSEEVEELTESTKAMTETIIEKDLRLEAVLFELDGSRKLTAILKAEKAALVEERDSLSQEIEIKTSNMVQMSEEYENMKRQVDDERIRISELEKGVGQLVSDLVFEKQRCSDVENNLREKLSEIDLLKSEIRDAENKNDELLEQVEHLESSGVAMADELFQRTHEKSELSAKVANLEKMLETEIKAKNAIVQEKDDILEILKRQWDEHELFVNQIETQQEEIDELKRIKVECEEAKTIHRAELQNEIFALQQNLEDTQQHAINLKEELTFKVASAEADLSAAQFAKHRRDEDVKELENKLASLESKFAALENRKQEYKLYAKELEAEKNALKAAVDESEKKSVNARKALEAESALLKAIFEEKEHKIIEERNELLLRISVCEEQNLSDSREIAELREKNLSLETIIQPFREQLHQYQKEKDQLLAKSENAEKEMLGLQKEHAKLLSHNNHRQKIHRVMQLTETINNLKKENEKLLKENAKFRAAACSKKESTIKTTVIGKENTVSEITKNPAHPASPLKTRNAH